MSYTARGKSGRLLRIEHEQLNDPEYLRERYVDQYMSARAIADELGCCTEITVRRRLKEFDIPMRITTGRPRRIGWSAESKLIFVGQQYYRNNDEEFNGHLWAPLHPLARSNGLVSLIKAKYWQDRNYDMDLLPFIRDCNPTNGTVRLPGEPSSGTICDGYIVSHCPELPIAMAKGAVRDHVWVMWQEGGYDQKFIDDIKSRKIFISHKNGKRDDNRVENLEIRLITSNKFGVGVREAKDILRRNGYDVDNQKEN